MKNNSIINIIFIVLLIFLSCKKASKSYPKTSSQQQLSKIDIKDSLTVEIDDNYLLRIDVGKKREKIDFFEPIKNKLINEIIYAQILYDKENVIINLEVGQNADIYEDLYLSKSLPITIEKIVTTTIIKNDISEKIECVEIINQPLLTDSKYKTINDKLKECKNEKME